MSDNLRGRYGVSLVEVLVASVVMVALVIPLLVVLSSTVRTTEVSLQEVKAQHLACEIMEQLKVLPFTVGYEWLFERPFPNPPSDYPNFLSLAIKGDLPCAGCTLPYRSNATIQRELEYKTDNWTIVGAPITLDTGPQANPYIAERARLFISPAPKDFRRHVQIYRPIRSLTPLQKESNIFKVVVKVEWPSARSASGGHMRHVLLTGFIGNPRIR